MSYPTRGMPNRQYKHLLNLFSELAFPFASDLFYFENVAKHRTGRGNGCGGPSESIDISPPTAGRVV
jgi:hypothetical protein